MKERDIFQQLRRKNKRFGLRAKLTVAIGTIVLISIIASVELTNLLQRNFPKLQKIPDFIQLAVVSLIIAMILSRIATRIFSNPIKQLREAMHKVADGDFSVELKVKSTASEIGELMAGFNLMVRELRSTEILQTNFVSNVSHEFKTPINAIEGYTTLLQNANNASGIENEYIEKILFNTRRLSSLVSNILLLSKLENQSIPTNQESYRLDEQIREEIVASEALWEPKKIDFDVDLAEIVYFGNENLMHHVWSNLLVNAIKFSPPEGVIQMRLQKENGSLVFYIQDEGPGISEEAKKRIFDKFYQEDSSHKEEGNGLGLALVKRILSLVGGAVVAENVPSGGCRFTVTLEENPN